MRIAVDLTALSDRFSGLERCALELTEHMIRLAADDRFLLIVKNTPPAPVRMLGKRSNVRFLRIRGRNKLLANQLSLAFALARAQADAVLFPVFPMPLLLPFLRRDLPVYGVIADTVCFDLPETMRPLQRLFWQVGLRCEAGHAAGIITVSEFSAGRIQKHLKVPEDRITVAPNGVKIAAEDGPEGETEAERKGRRDKTLARYGISKPYFLTLSTIEPRKEIPLLIRAYRELKSEGVKLPELVIAGRSGWMDETEDAEGIRRTGFVEEKDLAAVYAGAEAFIFPSRYEGFGLPPLEALSCGVRRVLVSDAPALREVMGDTARYFKRHDLASLKAALRELVSGQAEEAGEDAVRKNLERFSWEKSAERVRMEITHGE